ncbi:MAG: glutathione S-transferase [Parvibaculum sp.]|nr:glutathione S-transferase [Parvibaculum sp.]
MAARRKTSEGATRKTAPAKRSASAGVVRSSEKPIELYYWPTPNGWKISIMLEECRLPYVMKPVNIGIGDQFKRSFLRIAPNNRMPAIVDPDGPGGKSISIFESGAILQYLGRKTGKFYPANERQRVEVDQWLFWQMGGLGPMAGQAHHFRQYAQEKIPYAIKRYTNEVNRLYGVMNKRLKDRDYLAGRYSIADMACWGWVVPAKNQGQQLENFPHLKKWFERVSARPAVRRGFALGRDLRQGTLGDKTKDAEKARKILFGQRAN